MKNRQEEINKKSFRLADEFVSKVTLLVPAHVKQHLNPLRSRLLTAFRERLDEELTLFAKALQTEMRERMEEEIQELRAKRAEEERTR